MRLDWFPSVFIYYLFVLTLALALCDLCTIWLNILFKWGVRDKTEVQLALTRLHLSSGWSMSQATDAWEFKPIGGCWAFLVSSPESQTNWINFFVFASFWNSLILDKLSKTSRVIYWRVENKIIEDFSQVAFFMSFCRKCKIMETTNYGRCKYQN